MTLIAEGTSLRDMLRHPRHEAAQKVLPELITQLRQCTSVTESYEFQKALLDQVTVAETDRNGFSQAVKMMRVHKQPQAGTPEPQSGFDVSLPETWEFERDVCARVARQFRCVGDAPRLAGVRVPAPAHHRPAPERVERSRPRVFLISTRAW